MTAPAPMLEALGSRSQTTPWRPSCSMAAWILALDIDFHPLNAPTSGGG